MDEKELQVSSITTPCHHAPLIVVVKDDEAQENMCSAEYCYNSWTPTGESSVYNKPAE